MLPSSPVEPPVRERPAGARLPAGTRLIGPAAAEVEPAMRAAAARGAQGLERRTVDGRPAYLKYSRLKGSARLRYAWKAAFGSPAPMLREFGNLGWLRAHGFDAPEPLAAGVFRRRLLPSFQFLATEAIEAPTLRTLAGSDAPGPETDLETVLARVGVEAARLHAAGFVHRDLYPRNLLIDARGEALRIHLIDAWRGGPGPRWPGRGVVYDLACLALYAPSLWSPDGDRALFGAYFRERGRATGRTPGPAAGEILAAVARQRLRLVDRLRKRGRTEPPIPPRAWSPPEL